MVWGMEDDGSAIWQTVVELVFFLQAVVVRLAGLNGAILQIISHEFIDDALFFLAGMSFDRIRLALISMKF